MTVVVQVGHDWMKVLEVVREGETRLVADRNCSSALPLFPDLTVAVSCYDGHYAHNYNYSCGQFYQCTKGQSLFM